MTAQLASIIGTILLFAFSVRPGIDWTIKPGSGFDVIVVDHSTISDIQKILGEGKIKSTTWYYDCIKRNGKKKHKVKTLEYDSLGLVFTFQDDRIKDSNLESIKFTGQRNWQTSNNLTINISTRKDVYEAFGSPPKSTMELAICHTMPKELDFFLSPMTKSKRVSMTLLSRY